MTGSVVDRAEIALEAFHTYGLVDPLLVAARELIVELERLHTWDGLMSLLGEHYPEATFPTLPDDPDRDDGPRIVSLIRHIDALRDDNECGPFGRVGRD